MQSRVIRDRLLREAEGNVAIHVRETGEGAYEVAGRGELQLGVLIETMRREGFELSISRPRVLYQTDESGQKLEPIEEVTIDVDDPYTGIVIEKISQRKGEIAGHAPDRRRQDAARLLRAVARADRLSRRIPHRHARHRRDEPHVPRLCAVQGRDRRAASTACSISTGDGEAVAYALWYLEERGKLFIVPGTKVYQGMIIGEHASDNDLDVNPLRAKQLTNIRTTSQGRSGAPDAHRSHDARTGHRLYRG